MLPVREASQQPFASPAFEQLWLQSEPISLSLWGQTPLVWRIEPYAEAPNGRRLVQYFDRGRMELTVRAGSTAPVVSQGRLAWELTTGQIALGSDLFARQQPPAISIDGGATDPRVPTYASFSSLVSHRAPDRSNGEIVTDWLAADGSLQSAPPPTPARLSRYIALTGHNLPDVTIAFFNQFPLGPLAWIEVFGYPISEPVWAYYRHGQTASPSLIQVFERRILIYTPELPTDQRFTIANTGRHYYRWRYGRDPSSPWPVPLPGEPVNLLTPPGFQTGIYFDNVQDPVDLALAPDGNLLVLTRSGSLVLVTAEDTAGRATQLTTFASGFLTPRGLATAGAWVYVADDRGLFRLRDQDGDGIADQSQLLSPSLTPLPGAAGAPVVDETGRLYLAATLSTTSSTPTLFVVQDERLQPLAPLPPGLIKLFTWGELLFALLHSNEGPVTLVRFERTGLTLSIRPFLAFPANLDVAGGLTYTAELWVDPIPGTLIFWGRENGVGVLVRAIPRADGSGADITRFVSALNRPVAVTVGLDGVLYVADAGQQRVLKIVPSLRPTSPP